MKVIVILMMMELSVDYLDNLVDNVVHDRDNSIDGSDAGAGSDAEVESFKLKLAKIVIKNKSTLTIAKSKWARRAPKTRETLLHTPTIPIVPREVEPGENHHVGLKKSLQRSNYKFLIHQDIMEIDINIDDLSLSKSSKLKVWTILGAFPNKPDTSPFIIGTYVGYENPASI